MKASTKQRENAYLTGWCQFIHTYWFHCVKTLFSFFFHSSINSTYIWIIEKVFPRSFTGKKRHSDAWRQGAVLFSAEVKSFILIGKMSMGLYAWCLITSVWERLGWDIGEVPGAKEMMQNHFRNHMTWKGFLFKYVVLVLGVACI